MRILKGMMVCLAALFFLGYVNSCDSEPNSRVSHADLELNTIEGTSIEK